MDNSKLKKTFGLAATNVTNLYQTSIKFQEEAYKKGKIDAFSEVIAFCLENSKGNIKNVSQKNMIEYLQQKIAEVDSKSTETMIQSSKASASDNVSNISNISNNGMGISSGFSNNTNTSNSMLIEGTESGSYGANRFGNMNLESPMYNILSGGGERMQQSEFNQGFLQNLATQNNQNLGYTATSASKSQWELQWK